MSLRTSLNKEFANSGEFADTVTSGVEDTVRAAVVPLQNKINELENTITSLSSKITALSGQVSQIGSSSGGTSPNGGTALPPASPPPNGGTASPPPTYTTVFAVVPQIIGPPTQSNVLGNTQTIAGIPFTPGQISISGEKFRTNSTGVREYEVGSNITFEVTTVGGGRLVPNVKFVGWKTQTGQLLSTDLRFVTQVGENGLNLSATFELLL